MLAAIGSEHFIVLAVLLAFMVGFIQILFGIFRLGFLVNFLSGVTRVDLKSFIITTSIGIIPGSFVYTYAGSQLAHIDSIGDIFTKEILMAFILLGLLTLLPVIIKKINARKSANTSENIQKAYKKL